MGDTSALSLPSQDLLRSKLHYDEETGRLYSWPDGFRTFNYVRRGYHFGTLLGQNYMTHRVIWKMVYGEEPKIIDHINGDPSDNRLTNLRSVTALQNARNRRLSAKNKSGVPGVYFQSNRWMAKASKRYLGCFETFEEAVAARRDAERELEFHPNHGRAFVRAADAVAGQESGVGEE